jgi:hypothetical protein
MCPGNPEGQMLSRKAVGQGAGHKFEIQFERVYFFVGNFPFLCKTLTNDIFIQNPFGIVAPLNFKGCNLINNGSGLASFVPAFPDMCSFPWVFL